jgi:DNA mismatch endonuclease (patch repair protein)
MRQQRTRGTKPEMLLVDALRCRGFRIETHPSDLPGTPDIVLPVRGVAVFVHGCPWHYRPPRHNKKWWAEKITRNRDRDRRKAATLSRRGWRVVPVWEHVEPDVAAERVRTFATRR